MYSTNPLLLFFFSCSFHDSFWPFLHKRNKARGKNRYKYKWRRSRCYKKMWLQFWGTLATLKTITVLGTTPRVSAFHHFSFFVSSFIISLQCNMQGLSLLRCKHANIACTFSNLWHTGFVSVETVCFFFLLQLLRICLCASCRPMCLWFSGSVCVHACLQECVFTVSASVNTSLFPNFFAEICHTVLYCK